MPRFYFAGADSAIEGEVCCTTLRDARKVAKDEAHQGRRSRITLVETGPLTREVAMGMFNREAFARTQTDVEEWEPVGEAKEVEDIYDPYRWPRIRRVPGDDTGNRS